MNDDTLVVGIIPARTASTRLPQKLLLPLQGKPILHHTYQRARQAKTLKQLFIAAGDQEIENSAQKIGAPVITVFDSDITCGSERVWRASVRLFDGVDISKLEPLIVNIQADQPLLDPETIDLLVEKAVKTVSPAVVTPIAPIVSEEEFLDPAVVKVAIDRNHRALYFSRAPIPYRINKSPTTDTLWQNAPLGFRHIGIYAFWWRALRDFSCAIPTPLEQMESLEQLRLLEIGIPVWIVVVPSAPQEVNTPDDYQSLIACMGDLK
ncbi:MAG: 3-deoxy-manno-octulosonate cytidylyltransferase [bacterium]